jgi:hypothetical protein
MAGDGKARASWNLALIKDLAAECYARLVEKTARRIGEQYETLLPTMEQKGGKALSPLWEILVGAFYDNVAGSPVLYSSSTSSWVKPSSAVLPTSPGDSALLDVLKLEPSLPLVILKNDAVRRTLLDRGVTTRTTTPEFVRFFYSTGTDDDHPSVKSNHGNAKLLLKYAVSDLEETDTDYRELDGVRLIPMADGRGLGTFKILEKVDEGHVQQLVEMGFTKVRKGSPVSLHNTFTV